MSDYSSPTLSKVVSLCKNRGYFFQSSEIYGGLNGLYDKGHLGVLLEENIKAFWKRHMLQSGFQMVQYDGTIIGHSEMWKASGHVDGFHDPMVDCKSCKARFLSNDVDINKPCSKCGNKDWSDVKQFNMMFSTNVGAVLSNDSKAYLRPETAQSIFAQFRNIFSTSRAKIPFGIIQTGKAFRNEITPRQFLFRLREFSQMEMEFFVHQKDVGKYFDFWVSRRLEFFSLIGLSNSRTKTREYEEDELAHYSSRTVDVEFEFPFGVKELEGIAYRTDFDLSQHQKASGKDMSVFDPKTEEKFIPHVIECSVGIERTMLAVLCDSYKEEELVDGDKRVVLSISPRIAPIKAAVFPLTKNENELAEKIYNDLFKGFSVQFDASGSIGKRYRRQDEIGTPICVTVDSNSINNNTVTVRDRDTMRQEVVNINSLQEYILSKLINC
jgi:glycyl-tRNA synthetase